MSTGELVQPAPLFAAPNHTEYKQFTEVPVPANSGAASAWVGEVQPFRTDATACAFLRDAMNDAPIWIHAGSIQEGTPKGSHWADSYLVDMVRVCKVLVLLMPSPAHPRAYLLSPRFPNYYPNVHPHPRWDQAIRWDGRIIPGLCLYSAAEFLYDVSCDRMTQFLDQLTIYVGKHLIWLKTRQPYVGFPPHGSRQYRRVPEEPIIDERPMLIQRAFGPGAKDTFFYWSGFWPGAVAEGRDAESHLRTISPDWQCWCGSGSAYGVCHRHSDKKLARKDH